MSMIHPTAIVDKKAQIGSRVSIGAYSIIGPDVVIGDDTWVGPHVVINGPTVIGKDNKIFQFNSIGETPQHKAHKDEPSRLVIGNGNVIREYCTLHRGSVAGTGETMIGDHNFFMAYVHIAHDCVVGNDTTFANCASLAGHVLVGDFATLGGFTGIHQFCSVGAHAMTAIATISFKDIPPYVMAYGNTAKPYGLNTRGLKRRGFPDSMVKVLRQAYKILYRSGLKLNEALTELQPLADQYPEVGDLVSFIKSSERGIIR